MANAAAAARIERGSRCRGMAISRTLRRSDGFGTGSDKLAKGE
jgi:hypothetical protein